MRVEEMFKQMEPVSELINFNTLGEAAMCSIAVSIKRIADALVQCDEYGYTGSASIAQAIKTGLREGR